MDFYFPNLSACIDWRHRPRFRDQELAKLSFSATPDVMVADKLAEVRLHDGNRPICFQCRRGVTQINAMQRSYISHDYCSGMR